MINDPNDGWHSEQPWSDDDPGVHIDMELWQLGKPKRGLCGDLAAFIQHYIDQAA